MPQKKKADYFKRHAEDGKGGQSYFDRHQKDHTSVEAGFQDLPESKYPRSYSPREEAAIRRMGGQETTSIGNPYLAIKEQDWSFQESDLSRKSSIASGSDEQKKWDAKLSAGEKKIARGKKGK